MQIDMQAQLKFLTFSQIKTSQVLKCTECNNSRPASSNIELQTFGFD